IEFFVTQRPLSPHFPVIPVGKIFFNVFSILWETRNSGHRYYLYKSKKIRKATFKILTKKTFVSRHSKVTHLYYHHSIRKSIDFEINYFLNDKIYYITDKSICQ
ncbi:hypothetical protein LJB62_19305, partial [Bacillus sp. DFI.2.34]|nr:hypothetical protein [Bacillus sp. DFI.2.34]